MSYTLLIVALGTGILGLVSGVLGSFAVLKKQSLLGDAVSHASLPGITIAFLLTHTKSPLILAIGAGISGWLGIVLVHTITTQTKLKQDAALGVVLSVFFGFGLMMLTFIQKTAVAAQSGLNTFLFGSASTLLSSDLVLMGSVGAFSILTCVLLFKEFKLLAFDPEYLQTLGYPTKRLDLALGTLICACIVVGLQTVGVVLMSAMVIAPAAAARQWTDSLRVMIGVAAFFGMLSGMTGAMLSAYILHLPTGPTIVLVMGVIVFTSLLFSPHRGLIWGAIRHYRHHQNIREQHMLANLLLFSESQVDPHYAHDVAALTAIGRGPALKALRTLQHKGYVMNPEQNRWAITPEGLEEAKRQYAALFEGDS